MAQPVTVSPRRAGGIGQAVRRREDDDLVVGRSRYVDDLAVPGTLHACIVRSPFPRARLRAVDVSAALVLPGVVGAFDGRDLRADWAAPLPMIWAITPETYCPDHWPLAIDEAKYEGDAVAVVVAESPAAAHEAAGLVDVDYEPLAAVVDIEEALADGAVLVHPEHGTNRCYHVEYRHGDTDEVFRRAEVVVERTLRQQRLSAAPLETRAYLADPGPAAGDYVLYTSTQIPWIVRRTIAPCVGIPEQRLRVVAPDVGGAFGGKLNVYAEEALVLALARRLGRPVKWIEGRSESFVATTHGRGQLQQVALAATREGRILGVRVSLLVSMGAYLQLETPGIPILGQFLYGGAYGAEAYRFECTGVFTNQTPLGAYRGVGRAEAAYAIERMIDELAAELSLDPVDIRRRNLLPAGEKVTNAAGIPYDSIDFQGALDRAVDAAGYEDRRDEQAARRRADAERQLGIGLSVYVDSSGAGPSPLLGLMRYQGGGWESARVRVLPTGMVEVWPGNSPQGQGHRTAWSQIVSDVLAVGVDNVHVGAADTASAPAGVGTFASRSAAVAGTAIFLACERVLAKARLVAAHMLEVSEAEVEFDGAFSSGSRSLTLAEVAHAAHVAHSLPQGMAPGLEELVVYDPPSFTSSFGAHVAVVEVDRATGDVRVIRYVAVDDAGNLVNPLLAEGQVHGGLAQGIAQALYEELSYAEDGQFRSGSFLDYIVPGATELPSFELHRGVTPSTVNPLGAKGIAEVGAIGAPPAVINAVLDALRPFGVRHLNMPATPERVWRALHDAGAEH